MSKDKVILITGGTRGIGRSTAELCLLKGYSVIITSVDQRELDSAKAEMVNQGHHADCIETVVADMNDTEVVKNLPMQLKSLHAGLFGLVNNVGYEVLNKAVDFRQEEIEKSFIINVLSPILLIQACYPYLLKAKGNVVHIGSISDSSRDARYSIYGGCKAFMRAFVGHAAQEMGFDGVRINVVSPGATDTPLLRGMAAAGAWSEDELETFRKSVPIEQRYGYPEEMAEAVYFALTGPKYFHGEDIRVCGGHK